MAVFLVSVGMVAIFSILLPSGIKETSDSRHQIAASFLAQEGVDLIRNIRDNNWAKNKDSFYHLRAYSAGGSNDYECRVDYQYDYDTSGDVDCSVSSYDLYLAANGYYRHDSAGGDPTLFKRKIILRVSQNAVTATSMVVWGGSFPGGNYSQQINRCTTSNKCAYTQEVLGRWGE